MTVLKCVPCVQPFLFVVSSASFKASGSAGVCDGLAGLASYSGFSSSPLAPSPAFSLLAPHRAALLSNGGSVCYSLSLHVQPSLRGMTPMLHIRFAAPLSHRPAPGPAVPQPAGRAFVQHLVRLPSESAEQPALGSVRPLRHIRHLKASASWLTSRRGLRVDLLCGFVPGVSVRVEGTQGGPVAAHQAGGERRFPARAADAAGAAERARGHAAGLL